MSELWELGLHPAQAEVHEPIIDEELRDDLEPGVCCNLCGTTWNRLGGFRRLAHVTCPACGAGYADCGWNIEP